MISNEQNNIGKKSKNIYSVWFKIDLHIHTDLSKKTKKGDYNGNFSIKILHKKLKDQDVQVFSLTDHNIINTQAYEEYYTKYTSETDPLLLLGIELDIDRKGKTYHALLIFNYNDINSVKNVSNRLENKYKEKSLNFNERKLSLDEITEIFPEDDFFFIPHAGNKNSIIKGYEGEIKEAQLMLILFQSPLEKVQEKRRHYFNCSFDNFLKEPFRNKNDYAYIEFSDNHNIDEYPCKHKGNKGNHEFYYIKGSKNFETLRLAFIDPKSRIKSSPDFKMLKKSRNYIESLKIQSSSMNSNLLFSPHLNVIIGGRSSGKSLLMNIIHRCITQLNPNKKYDKYIEEKELEVLIKSEFDSSFVDEITVETSIIQIDQGDIIRYFEDKKLEDLARKTGKIDDYNKAKQIFIKRKSQLENLINELQLIYEEAFDLDVTKKIVLHKRTIDRSLSNVYVFNVDFSKIEKNFPNKKTFTDNEFLLSSMLEKLMELKSSGYFSFSDQEDQVFKDFEKLIQKKKKEIDLAIITRSQIENFLKKVKENVQEANSTLTKEGQDRAQANDIINNIITDTRKIFSTLNNLKRIIDKIESYDYSYKEEIILDSESKLCLEVHSKDKINDYIIDSVKDAKTQNLYLCLLQLLNGNKQVKSYRDNKPESLKKKINKNFTFLYNLFDNPEDFLEYKDETNSKNNSPGYNSEKYLQVVLNNPESNLIFIDQPEDNLGNKFISQSLVDLIRELKFHKQIFLVTHNPAIVVYGDAESIIRARNDKNEITYTQIKLEDELSQREICSVLDGGEYVFDNRAKKYNINKLLNPEV